MKALTSYKKSLSAKLSDFFTAWEETKNIHTTRNVYYKHLSDEFDAILSSKETNLTYIVYFSAALRFWPILVETLKSRKTKPNKKSIFFSKTEKDNINKETLSIFSEKINFIKKSKNDNIEAKISLRDCLKLIEKYQIDLDEKIIQKIKLANYGIDWRQAEKGVSVEKTLDINGAAKLLSRHLNEEISPHNVLEMCLHHDIGCYIYYGPLGLREIEEEALSLDISLVDEALQNNLISIDYKVEYSGLLRLKRDNSEDVDSLLLAKATVQHLVHCKNIALNHREWLPYQLSVSQFLLQTSKSFFIQKPVEITFNDLRFIESELSTYIESIISSQNALKFIEHRQLNEKESRQATIFLKAVLDHGLKKGARDAYLYSNTVDNAGCINGGRFAYQYMREINITLHDIELRHLYLPIILLIKQVQSASTNKNHVLSPVVNAYNENDIMKAVQLLQNELIEASSKKEHSLREVTDKFKDVLKFLKTLRGTSEVFEQANRSSTILTHTDIAKDALINLMTNELDNEKLVTEKNCNNVIQVTPAKLKNEKPHELIEHILNICKKNRYKIDFERCGAEKLWNFLSKNTNNDIKNLTEWTKYKDGKITYFSKSKDEYITRSQQRFCNLFSSELKQELKKVHDR